MSINSISMDSIEHYKENYIPLKTGRTIKNIVTTNENINKPNEYKLKISLLHKKYQDEIDNYKGEDILQLYHNYIKVIADNIADLTSKKSELLPILEKGTLQFIDIEIYKNDHRYLKMWMRYAELCYDSLDIFSFLRSKSIGQIWALFYESWAAILEDNNNYSFADAVYREGIKLKASPIERLETRYNAFLERWNKKQPNHTDIDENGRPMLRPLSSYDNTHTAVSQPIISSNSKPSFEIFQDTTPNSSNLGSTSNGSTWTLGTQKERIKENNNISSWLKFTLPQKKVGDLKKPNFEVFVETDSTNKAVIEKKQPEIINKVVTPKAEYAFPAAEPGCTRMYHASMLVSNNEELSFEEIRANINAQKKQAKVFESTPSKDVEMGDYTVVMPKESKKKVDPKYSFGASPTIHTKAALQDVLNIFEDSTLNFSKISHMSPSNSMSAFTLHHKLAAMKDDTQTNVSSFLVFEDNVSTKSSTKFEVYDDNAENRGVIAPPRMERASFNSILAAKEDSHTPLIFRDTSSPVEIEELEFKSIVPNYQSEPKYSFEIYEDKPEVPFFAPKEKLNTPASKLSNILNVEEPSKSKPSADHSNDFRHFSKTPTHGGLPTIIESNETSFMSDTSLINDSMSKGDVVEDEEDSIRVADPFDVTERNSLLESVNILQYPNTVDCRHMNCPIDINNTETDLELADKFFNISSKFELTSSSFALAVRDLMEDDVSISDLLMAISRPENLWEFYMNHQLVDRIHTNNSPLLKRIIITHREMIVFKDASCVVSPFSGQSTLYSLIKLYEKNKMKFPEQLAMFYTIEILRIVDVLQSNQFVHCNIHPLSFMIRNEESENTVNWGEWNADLKNGWMGKGLGVYNFQNTIDISCYPENTQFMGMPTDCKLLVSCPDMVSNSLWVYQQDAYGVAACIHLMMHGVELETKIKNKKVVPKLEVPSAWQKDLWENILESLLNVSADTNGNFNTPVPYVELKRKIENYLQMNLSDTKALKLQLCQQNIMFSQETA